MLTNNGAGGGGGGAFLFARVTQYPNVDQPAFYPLLQKPDYMMILSQSVRLNISLCLSIVLAIGQVLTVTALIILFKAYSDLKKKATECQRNLSLIEAQTTRNEERTETRSTTATLESEINKKWQKNGEGSPTRVPSPPSNRRSGYKQETFDHRTHSSNSQEMTRFPRDTSFTSARSRDSGTGSITTRTPQSSISCESKMRWQEPITEGDSKQVESRPVSCNEPMSRNQNEHPDSRSSRLQTMAIGMIGLEENDLENERWHKDGEQSPASCRVWIHDQSNKSITNENELGDSRSSRLQTMAIGMIGMEKNGLENEGFHEGNEGSNEDFTTRSDREPTLTSEELVRDLNSKTQQTRKEIINMRWHKDEEEIPTRVPTPPSNRRSKQNQNEHRDSHSSRLQTMAIEMIGLEEKSLAEERKNERASRLLSQRKKAIDEVPSRLINDESIETQF